jgi:hypothetical protein
MQGRKAYSADKKLEVRFPKKASLGVVGGAGRQSQNGWIE